MNKGVGGRVPILLQKLNEKIQVKYPAHSLYQYIIYIQ